MPLPVTMTIAGTIPLLICIFLWLTQKENFHAGFGIRLLKLSIFFYLVPVQLLYHILPDSIYYAVKFWEAQEVPFDEPIQYYYNHEVIVSHDGYYTWIPSWAFSLCLIWLICILVFAIIQIQKYRKLVKHISACPEKETVSKNTCTIPLKNLHSPCSVGFFHSFILVPEKTLHSKYKDILYRHEFCHIKNKDAWLKLLCLIAICLHFYNPFAYVLLFMYNTLCEYVCDAYAVSNLTEKEKKEYAILLVNSSEKNNPLPFVWKNSFAGAKLNLKRRISYFMKKEERTCSKRLISVFLSFVSIFLCTSTILAYEPLETTAWDPKTELKDGAFMEFRPLDSEGILSPKRNYDFSESNVYWQSENGEPLPILNSTPEIQKACSHTFKAGIISYHYPNSSGGCTVKDYRITRCTQCGYEKNRTLENTITYQNCPH